MALKRSEKRLGIYFFLPAGIIIVGVIIYPLLFSLATSFTTYGFLNPFFNQLVWFENYRAIFDDVYFWNSLYVIFKFVFVVVALEFCLGFCIALLLNRKIKAKGVFYTVLTIPMVMAPVAVALIWRVFLHPELGVMNYFLSFFKIKPVNWLGSEKVAFWTVVMVDIWQQVSFMILMLLAGLVSLPSDPYEAAAIDGASAFQRFFYITLPLMKPVIVIALLIRIIFGFRTFDLVYILTRGGPGVTTDVMSYYIYRRTFMGLSLSESSAASFILLFITLFIVVFLHRALRIQREV
ncbi:MAG: carbohydrate ABC transporter permease [Spirochaetota bacterium]